MPFLIHELLELRNAMLQRASTSIDSEHALHVNFRASANNLLHYLALRDRDMRPLQLRLAALGLSSLGRAESHVLANIDTVLGVLHGLTSRPWSPDPPAAAPLDLSAGQALLADNAEALRLRRNAACASW